MYMTGQCWDPVPGQSLSCHDSRSQTVLEIGNSPGLLPYCVGGLAEITWAHSVTTVAAWLANS